MNTNNRLLSATLLWLLLLTALSCKRHSDLNEDTEEQPQTLGSYVYRDDNGAYHLSSDCYNLCHGRDDKGHRIYNKQLIDTLDLVTPEQFRACTNCVNDANYQRLQQISDRNKQRDLYRKILHRNFSKKYSDIPEEMRVFFSALRSNEQWSFRIHELAVENQWFEGSFQDFKEYYEI